MTRRRFILRAACFPALGLLTTLVVAWTCTLRAPILALRNPGSFVQGGGLPWPRRVPAGWLPPHTIIERGWFGVHTVSAFNSEDRAGEPQRVFIGQAGWPLPALESIDRGLDLRGTPVHIFHTLEYISIERGLRYQRIAPNNGLVYFGWVPLRPAWPGLAADTLIYASLWTLLLLGPGAIRRQLRARRNLCARCGYPLLKLGPGAPCPECGHAADEARDG